MKLYPPPKVLVFDSGAGGLSVAKEIIALRPDCQLIFVADREFFPYGLKSDDILTQRIVSQIEILHKNHTPDIVVIACNTASTLALDILRKEFDCPFVGVVPAIKPATLTTQTKVIGVLATQATIKRGYTQKLIDDFASDFTVILHGSTCLAEIAENKILHGYVDKNTLKTELERLLSQPDGDRIDTVVLACTHYPLLKEDMDEILKEEGRRLTWVDSGRAIARRVDALLNQRVTESLDVVKDTETQGTDAELSASIEMFFLGENLEMEELERKYRSVLTK